MNICLSPTAERLERARELLLRIGLLREKKVLGNLPG